MRTLGVIFILAALIVGGAGIVERREATGGADARGELREVDAAGLRDATGGEAVLVPGTVATGEETAAPISGDEVAWWAVERRRHVSVETQDCTTGAGGERNCTDVTRAEIQDAGIEQAGTLVVAVSGDDELLLTLPVPSSRDAIRLVDEHESVREESDTGGSDWVEAVEFVLEDGEAVTIAGRRGGSRDAPTITPISGVPHVFGGNPDEAKRALDADAEVGAPWIRGGALLLVIGIGLFLAGRARARHRAPQEAAQRAEDLEESRAELAAAQERAAAARAEYEATIARQQGD